MNSSPRRSALQIALLFLLFGTVWIVLSDQLIIYFVHNQESAVLFQTVKGTGFVLCITLFLYWERTRSEQRHQQSEEQYRALIEQAADGIAIGNLRGNILQMNPAGAEMFGWSSVEMEGRNVRTLIAPEDLAQMAIDLAEFRTKQNIRLIWRLRRRDGSTFLAEVNGRLMSNGLIHVVFRDVTEQIRYQERLEEDVRARTNELEWTSRRLQELDRLKTKFIADISHELRHPIANLVLYLSLLREATPQKRARYEVILDEQINLLRRIIEEILDFSRLMMNDSATLMPLDLKEIVETLCQQFAPTHQSSPVTLRLDPIDEPIPILGDETLLTQALGNILRNAITYTEQGDVIVRVARLDDRQVQVEVQDSGEGIGEEDLPHIFTYFYRGQNSSQRTLPGSGLGLSIANEIVQLHGGCITVESQPGAGSIFRIILPRHTTDS